MAPYTAELRDKELNLLYQLKKKGKIDAMVFSFYMKMYSPSHFKIGGFDEIGALNNVTGNKNFTFVKTQNNNSWKMKLMQARVFGETNDIATWEDG